MPALRVGASPLTLAWSEFKLRGFSRIDALAFNRDGDIVLVECKLARNRASTRTALGQILEHASRLTGRKIDELDKWIVRKSPESISSLDDAMRRSLGPHGSGWDATDFRRGVESALRDGRFTLVIAIDKHEGERLTKGHRLFAPDRTQ